MLSNMLPWDWASSRSRASSRSFRSFLLVLVSWIRRSLCSSNSRLSNFTITLSNWSSRPWAKYTGLTWVSEFYSSQILMKYISNKWPIQYTGYYKPTFICKDFFLYSVVIFPIGTKFHGKVYFQNINQEQEISNNQLVSEKYLRQRSSRNSSQIYFHTNES